MAHSHTGKWQFNIFISFCVTCKRCKPVPNFDFSQDIPFAFPLDKPDKETSAR